MAADEAASTRDDDQTILHRSVPFFCGPAGPLHAPGDFGRSPWQP
jgi:hypothetical protein